MWPFKRKQHDIATLPPLASDGHIWGVAESGFVSSPLIIRYNETAREWIGHSKLPVKLGIAIPLNSPNEAGLPNPDENEQLNAIEDIVVQEISARTVGLQALALTTGIMKEYVFYIPRDVDIKTIHESIQALVTTHEIQCMADMEPEWESYVQFAPR